MVAGSTQATPYQYALHLAWGRTLLLSHVFFGPRHEIRQNLRGWSGVHLIAGPLSCAWYLRHRESISSSCDRLFPEATSAIFYHSSPFSGFFGDSGCWASQGHRCIDSSHFYVFRATSSKMTVTSRTKLNCSIDPRRLCA